MNWLKNYILRWLGIDNIDGRLVDVERHFVTKRNTEGAPIQTLADVPLAKRNELKTVKTAGMSWQQRRAFLEATDGDTRGAVSARLPSTS